MLVSRKSAYDSVQATDTVVTRGRKMETKWQEMLQEIWMGYCYAQTVPYQLVMKKIRIYTKLVKLCQVKPDLFTILQANGVTSQDQMQVDTTDTASKDTSKQSEQQGLDPTKALENLKGEKTASGADSDMYPKLPDKFRGCRLLISEVSTKNGRSPSFIELERKCPKGVRDKTSLMAGYHLIAVRVGDPSKIYLSISLDKLRLREVEEINPASKRPKTNHYFVIGSEQGKVDLLFNEIEMMVWPPDGIRGIQQEETSTFAIILLYMPNALEIANTNLILGLRKRDNLCWEKDFGDEQRFRVKKYVQDVFLYGAPCPVTLCEEFTNMIPNKVAIEPVTGLFSPVSYIHGPNQSPPFITMNRCTDNLFPMQLDYFFEGPASPGSRNICPITAASVFPMSGVRLQSSAQKLIVNINNFFMKYYATPVLLEGTPEKLTAKVTSMPESAVYRVLNNWRANTIATPNRKRNNPFLVQCRIDSFNRELIRRTIQNIYKENRPPFAFEIYKNFMTAIRNHENQERQNGKEVEEFNCHEKTFRKILHRLGYKFGKIHTRDSILMRPDIVRWRGRYLQALENNRKSENPMPVIWLDGDCLVLKILK